MCLCKKCFESYDQTIINLISHTNENKNCQYNYDDSDNFQETHYSDDVVTADRICFSENN